MLVTDPAEAHGPLTFRTPTPSRMITPDATSTAWRSVRWKAPFRYAGI